ncbi:CRISPR-associated protein Csx11 [Chloroflexus sp. MS-G]|uniref:CRISPR-associated protein Csx11 n=1 Tax=Chloroflexus sp. MS-G TaxID=1521187 RepID=UPI0004DF29AB|nr:CRISPR-associated protein Csx11 [Chloroflexus sp. MS-G]
MMSLKVLKDNRDALLLSEVAALLHDVGKFCNLHIEAHTGGQRRWSNDHAYKAVIDSPGAVIKLSKAAASLKKPNVLNNVLNAQSPKAADFISTNLKDFLQNNTINLFGESYSLAELIMLGTPGFATDKNRPQLLDGKSGWLAAVLGVCHNEAHVDKEDPPPGQGNQTLPYVFISTAFGYEAQKVVVNTSPQSLDSRLQNLLVPPTSGKLLEEFAYGLGDTRRPVNEVTLSDWSWIVAALFKPAIAGALLNNNQPAIRQWKSWRDKVIDHDLRWRLLRVNFDVLALYAKAIKIADLLGYQRVVDKACETVKQLVEEEYPLGNEIYRDSTGIYFTFPDLDLPADLAQEIRHRVESVEMELAPRIAVTVGDGTTATDQLKSILGKARKEALEALAQPFDSQQLIACWQQQWTTVGAGQWEVCPVCRLRPMPEKAEACEHCIKRRSSRIEAWKQNPAQTIWIDEIADHNDRVALIVGRFGLEDWLSGDLVQTMLVKAASGNPNDCVPKNPSPARLRRVWETCQRFWTETVEREILARHHSHGAQNPGLRCARLLLTPDKTNSWREDVPYDGVVNGGAISLLWRKDVQQFITISNLELAGDIQPGQTIVVSEPDRPQQISFVIQNKAWATGKYTPYLRLLASPDQFLALVPAAAALEIAKNIRQEYQRQFGKVQNRLPLFLGLVFFQRKVSLTAVMDTARRMLAAPLKDELWTVGQDVTSGQVKFMNDVEWNIPTVMGDGTTPDSWYPYFFVTKGKPNCQRCFQLREKGRPDPQKVGSVSKKYADRWLVHMSDLKQDDVVQVTPSRFAYLFLENTARRFRFDPERDVMLLDELPRLMKMWDDLKSSGITDTGLRNVQALLEHKGETWGRGEEFEHLACTTLKEAGLFERKDQNGNPLSDVVTPQDVVSGRFARCLELHLYILKLKIKES